jgi:hypothetical protein
MAKDPALAFYWNDWHGGTVGFTRHQKGCYMDLLHAQFNSGPLSLNEIKNILGSDFSQWDALRKKFTQTGDGLFFNERMETERNKRKAYTESRKNNLKGVKNSHMGTHMDNHMAPHMDNDNDIDNEIEIKGKRGAGEKGKFTKPTVEEVKTYSGEIKANIDAQRFIDHYESNGWKVGGKSAMKDWKAAVRNWAKNNFGANSRPVVDTKTVSDTSDTPAGKLSYGEA